jgi:ABC-type antimicrobial peptide transport system permease subunit
MKFVDTFFVNVRKLKERTGKALFLIIPICLLVALSIVVSSQVKNFQAAADQSIFGTIEDQSLLIEMRKGMGSGTNDGPPGSPGQMFGEDSQYAETDLAAIEDIDHVESATLNSTLPVSNVQTTDLFEDTTISLGSLSELDESIAALYTEESFTYNEGDPIPVILNANSFMESYEDWGDETSITFDMSTMRAGSDPQATSPYKTQAIEYDKDELIGTEFTVDIGGLSALTTSKMERSDTTITITQLTDDEIEAAQTAREEAIATYWDYDEISTPLTFTFVVVGIIEDAGGMNQTTYVPTGFTDQLMQEYIQNQLDARTDTALTTDLLNSTFLGLTYDGLELADSSGFGGSRRMGGGMMMPGGPVVTSDTSDTDTTSYTIPGLVIELADDDSGDVVGAYTDADVYSDVVKSGDTITVKIASVYDRAQVVADINTAGFAFQDMNNMDVFSNLKNTLSKVTTGLVIAFIAITVAVVILTMSKFVSDSRKEIGIFRAIGVTKKDIIKLFVSQAVLYTAVGYVVGVGLGLIANVSSAKAMSAWFDKLVGNTIKETYGVVNDIDVSLFSHVDWHSLGVFSAILVGITLIISLIPALKASSISPVEAIRNE